MVRKASVLILSLAILFSMVLPATAVADDGGDEDDCQTGWFYGHVFRDADWDGEWDDSEQGISGCRFTARRLRDGWKFRGCTNGDGWFGFDTSSESWEICVEPEQDWTPTCSTCWTCESWGRHRFGMGQCGDEVPPVPEFPTYGLLGIGLVGIGGFLGLRRLRQARTPEAN